MALFSPPETLNEPPLNLTARTARMNSLAYTQSAQFRDPRLQSRKSTPNWLVVVVPTPSLTQEPQLHAHTLATSPQGRFADGIIIPLFPSLYAQLAAIAREYSMPSTVGLCIYLQTPHAGALTTPRISDETWPLLWNHLNDADASRSLSGPPIAARIEFDIDQRKGRWLDTWLGLSRKASVDLNPNFRTSWHQREENKMADKVPFDYATPEPEPEHEAPAEDYVSVSRKASPPRTRGHLRRLSLLRGSDSSFLSSSPAKPTVNNLPTIISPSPQVELPVPDPNQELAERVQSWREGSLITPPEHSEKHASTDGNLQAPGSNTAVEQHAPPQEDEVSLELNLDDFAWSISSLGPGTNILSPLQIPSPAVSVHLVGRLAGSVCLTPSTATSFGPNDDAFDYDAFTASRLPSPDIAYRAIEDVPCTPTTATSWGAPSWTGSEDVDDVEIYSVDLAYRCAGSVPATPVEGPPNTFLDAWKMTPWGLMWPFSVPGQGEVVEESLWAYNPSRGAIGSQGGPSHWSHNATRGGLTGTRQVQAATIKAAEQTSFVPYNTYVGYLEHSNFLKSGSVLSAEFVSPSADAWKLSPWGHIWPYSQRHQASAEESIWPLNASRGTVATSSMVHWPYNPTRGRLQRSSDSLTAQAPAASPSPPATVATRSHAYHGYLQNSAFLAVGSVLLLDESFTSQDAWKLSPWGHIWPYTVSQVGSDTSNASKFGQTEDTVGAAPETMPAEPPALTNYSEQGTNLAGSLSSASHDAWKVTPWGFIWPYNTRSVGPKANYCLDVQLQVEYPVFNLYPAAYPFLEIYPRSQRLEVKTDTYLDVQLQAEYPNFNLYPAAYPFLEIYPLTLTSYPVELETATPAQAHFSSKVSVTATELYSFDSLSWAGFDMTYPDLTIYPATSPKIVDVLGYPFISLYPAVYPEFDLYQAPAGQEFRLEASSSQRCISDKVARVTSLATESPPFSAQAYPQLLIYPSTYPVFDLYPRLTGELVPIGEAYQVIELHFVYPVFALYPPVYPHIEPYPPVFNYLPSSPTTLMPDYDLRGHCHVYPNIAPYPTSRREVQTCRRRSYPTLHGQIFQDETVSTLSGSRFSTELQLRTRRQLAYDLRGHQHAYPHIEPYRPGNRQRRTHVELHNFVFKTGYKPTPSTTQISQTQWALSLTPVHYPRIEPYPALLSASATQNGKAIETKHSYRSQTQWVLSLTPVYYPHIEPYPALSSANTVAQDRIKRLALALNRQDITPQPSPRRISIHGSPGVRSFASGLYSPLQPPPISPPLC